MDDAITALVALAIVVEAGAAQVSAAYIWWVYRQRREPSEYLHRLVIRDIRVALGCIPIVVLVIYGALIWAKPEWHLQPVPRPWGSIAIGIPVVIFIYGVISDAVRFWLDRRIGANRAGDAQ